MIMKKTLFIVGVALSFLLSCATLSPADTVSEYVNKMTLREKVGQLMMVGIQGQRNDAKDTAHIKKINPGGIIFYGRNLKDAGDIPQLIVGIESLLSKSTFPMFFAVDQEGGLVHRVEGEMYRPPSAPAIGAANSEALSREVGQSVGGSLRALGINVNLAPVLDVPANIISSPMLMRSFSNNHETVSRLGTAYILGLKDAGILATAKHFPGIGRAQGDSHVGLPRITWERQDDREKDMLPFRKAITAGVDIVMVGHFVAEPGDSKYPVSLSLYWMEQVLRKDMGFDGLIIVDNIEMKGIRDIMPIAEAAVKSFQSGADMIMVSHEKRNQEVVFNALLDAVTTGKVSHERLNVSMKRIMGAKMRIMSSSSARISDRTLKDISKSIAEASITYLSTKESHPLIMKKGASVLYMGYNSILFSTLKDFFGHAEILNTTLENYRKVNPEIPVNKFMKKFDAVIMDADYTDALEIISTCVNLNKEYVVILTLPGRFQKTIDRLSPGRIVLTFENTKIHLNMALEIISGIRKAKGKLPYNLTLPESYVNN